MERHGLSHGERRALYAMEEMLRHDAAALDRQLRTMTLGSRHRLAGLLRRPLALVVLLLWAGSVALLVIGIRTSSTGVIWGFSACCAVTLLAATRLSRTSRAPEVPRSGPPRR